MLILFILSIVTAEIIPRHVIFSAPEYSNLKLSPDGKYLAFIKRDRNNIGNVFLRNLPSGPTRQVTFESKNAVLDGRVIQQNIAVCPKTGYGFTALPDIIYYSQENNGDENTMLFAKNVSQKAIRTNRTARSVISDRIGVKAKILGNNYADPRLLVAINDVNSTMYDVYSYELLTKKLTLVMRNKRFPEVYLDNDLNIRIAYEEQKDGTAIYYSAKRCYRVKRLAKPGQVLSSDKNRWEKLLHLSTEDSLSNAFMGFDKTNNNVYWLWSDSTNDLDKVVMFPIKNAKKRITLFQPSKGGIGSVLWNYTDKSIMAITELYHKNEWYSLDGSTDDIQKIVDHRPTATPYILSHNTDQDLFLLMYDFAEKPAEYFLYRRSRKSIEPLLDTQPQLRPYRFNSMVGFTFTARDGLLIQAYLSFPQETPLRSPRDAPAESREYAELGILPLQPQKMIISVHGGPNLRDSYGFDTVNAWLTNRGYIVLQVNFRGSNGFGRKFINAGNGEWGRKMHYDILDALEFAVDHGIANKSEIAILVDYGGYEVLTALTKSPEVFACGIDIVGPSSLITLLETLPSYWEGFRMNMEKRLGGNPSTREGRELLESRSPLNFADKVTKPILIMQGANDPRVNQQESDQFVNELKKHNIPVTYVLYPDEGHGFRKERNVLAQYGFIEEFLHSCLGGEYEPYIPGQYGSSAIVKSKGFVFSKPHLDTAPFARAADPSFMPPANNLPKPFIQFFFRII